MSRTRGVWVALVAAFTVNCASGGSSGGGVHFISIPISTTEFEVEYSAALVPSHQRALEAVCRCSTFALGRGFAYLRISNPQRLGPGTARWRLELYRIPPSGATVLDVAAPTWQGKPPTDSVVDAASFAVVCAG